MTTLDKVTSSAHDAYDKVADAGRQAVDTLSERGEQFKNVEQRLVKDCRGYISQNPISTLGIGVAVGFLLSRLLNRR
ncbi:MAG: DUF883 domain-containing protein [Methylococcales bacterium]|nr:DUF883 family protein [Methylococcaceae bacterium]